MFELKKSSIFLFTGFALLFVLNSCQPYLKEYSEIKTYLINDLGIDFKNQDDLYIFLPITSCSNCIDATIEFLSHIKGDTSGIHIVSISYSLKEVKPIFVKLEPKYDVIYDKNGMAYKNNLFVSASPTVIHVKNDKISKLISYTLLKNFHKMEDKVSKFIKK